MKLPKGYNQYGAFMGRRGCTNERWGAIKMHLCKIPLNQGGYDSGGAYWGYGQQLLWRAWGDGPTEQQELWLRADNRDEAKQIVRKTFPKATFYR